jgi:2-methylcitrate dehydratase PrpD
MAPAPREGDIGVNIAEQVGDFATTLEAEKLPAPVRAIVRNLILDVAGLCVAARNTDYIAAALKSAVSTGDATAIGHAGGFNPYDAALINGTAAHGEDYDDTFEGGPVHAGAVIVPAVLAAVEHRGLSGVEAVKGIAAGVEIMCRMALVAPQAMHRAGFHPTAVIGAPAAAAAVGAALGLSADRLAQAMGVAGSLASGIIEYLADGSSTKRLHAGSAAQSGLRSALLAEAGFSGPKSVLEGTHGFYKAFAPSRPPDFGKLILGLGHEWVMQTLAFKPYACGTMTQPYIDCAIVLAAAGLKADDIVAITCEVGEGTVHRLWEPLDLKRAPPNGYAGKFSTPYCIAVGFLDGKAGFAQFTDERSQDPRVRALAARISYVIDPANPYPAGFTGHIRAELKDGTTREFRRSHMRGGAQEPLSQDEIATKFRDNVRFGGWDEARGTAFAAALDALSGGGPVNLEVARN